MCGLRPAICPTAAWTTVISAAANSLSVKGVGADFHESLLKEVRMEECGLSFANFSGTRWESAIWNACDMQESYLADCVLRKWNGKAEPEAGQFFPYALKGNGSSRE